MLNGEISASMSAALLQVSTARFGFWSVGRLLLSPRRRMPARVLNMKSFVSRVRLLVPGSKNEIFAC